MAPGVLLEPYMSQGGSGGRRDTYCIERVKNNFKIHLPYRYTSIKTFLLSARTAMWSMPVVLTETENENDSANQNDVAKMM